MPFSATVDRRRLFSAVQGPAWGEGGLFRAEESLILDADLYATSVPAIAPCSAKASCEHGVYDADCNCVCDADWLAPTSGGPCTICTDHCTNGVLDKADCSCACTAGYFGVNCDNYILGQWLSADLTKKQATIQFSWDLSADRWKGASKVSRYAALPANAQPQISGTSVAMPERKGTVTVALNLASKITGYPVNQFAYAVDLSLGTNEFGASKGFTKLDLPLFEYDAAKNCVKGGHLINPTAPMATNPALCVGMVAIPTAHAGATTAAAGSTTAAAGSTTAAAGATTAAAAGGTTSAAQLQGTCTTPSCSVVFTLNGVLSDIGGTALAIQNGVAAVAGIPATQVQVKLAVGSIIATCTLPGSAVGKVVAAFNSGKMSELGGFPVLSMESSGSCAISALMIYPSCRHCLAACSRSVHEAQVALCAGVTSTEAATKAAAGATTAHATTAAAGATTAAAGATTAHSGATTAHAGAATAAAGQSRHGSSSATPSNRPVLAPSLAPSSPAATGTVVSTLLCFIWVLIT